METSRLYDNPDYSDLAILLSDGRKIHVHKLVLCNNNEYFKKLCGVGSRFSERNLSTIELKEDNANAMERVLLNIYQDIQPITAQLAQSWRYWLNVYVVADKYLEPKSIDQALTCVRTTIQSLENIDEIFNLYEALVTEMTHYDVFVELAAQLQRSHLDRLLDCDRFCRHVENDKDAMWKIVKSLRIARDEALRPKARPGALELELPNPLNLNYLNHLNNLNNFVQPRQSIRDPPRLKR